MDADLVVNLRADQIDEFTGTLKADFYVTFARGGQCSLIHYASVFKFDISPLLEDEYSQTQFGRRQFAESRLLGDEPIECAFASAEDTVLNKLRWYRISGETSEREWNDLRGILQVKGDSLDRAYLDTWAPRLEVGDLLARLFAEQAPKLD